MSHCRVVGYANVSSNGVMYVPAGAVFTPVNGAKTYQLKDWKPDGIEEGDKFQLLSAENTKTIGRYCYVSKTYADYMSTEAFGEPDLLDHAIGWWQYGEVDWEDTECTSASRADTTPINVGDSFLIACGETRNFVAQSSGAVPTAVTSIERKNVTYPFFCNYLPVDVKFGNITVDGVEEGDKFQILSTENTKTIGRYCYVSKAYADYMSTEAFGEPDLLDYAIGWWQYGEVDWEDTEGVSPARANNAILAAGQGVLVAAGEVRNVTISFPSALEATK